MTSLAQISRGVICIIITLFFILHIEKKFEIPLLNGIENIVYDLRLSLTTPNSIDSNIVIIDIDEKSLAQEGRWPWSRDKMSYLMDILFDYYQIKLLGFDMVFAEPDTSSGLSLLEDISSQYMIGDDIFANVVELLRPQLNYDQLFADSLKGRPVVLGYYFNQANNTNPNSALPPAIELNAPASKLNLIKEYGYNANLALFQHAAGASAGYFNNSTVDADGVFRRLPILSNYNNQAYETLALAMYRRLMNYPSLNFTFHQYGQERLLESVNVGELSIPVDHHGVALVPYRGKQGSFNYISLTDILNATVPIEALENKITLLGTTAPGLLDLRTTPVQNLYAGVEVHANVLSAMFDHSFKAKPSYIQGAEILLLATLALLIILLYPRLSPSASAIVFGLIAVSLISFNFYSWQYLHLDIVLATPLLLLFLLFSVQLLFSFLIETQRRNRLSQIFGQYIPAEIVDEMSQSDTKFTLKGELKEMSVLFSDVRGFTSISEAMAPEELCNLVNDILTPITEVIHHNKGTIDKYIGDAVMAFWGAPVNDEHHALNAVRSALAFNQIIEQLNITFKEKAWPSIDMGVGISTGLMNVGNMGSQFRMAYTVMGDTVNLGSRLEGLTKRYGVRIIVSDSTYQATPEIAYLELDRVLVKGKQKPVTIYEPISFKNEVSSQQQALIDKSSAALATFYRQDWERAEILFKQLNTTNPEKRVFQLYLERTEQYKHSPPDDGWDGVFTHQSK